MQPAQKPPRSNRRSLRLARLASCFGRGVKKGLRSGVWLLAIMVPVSFAVMLLDWSGILSSIAVVFEPLFRLVGLPGEIAAAVITGVFLNIYASIAAMGPIPLTDKQVTIVAIIVLISHNFPVELAVQKKTGTAAWKMILLRLGMSALGAVSLHLFLPEDGGEAVARGVAQVGSDRFVSHVSAWAIGSAGLIGKVLVLILGLMILHQLLIKFGVTKALARIFYPVLYLLGLPRSAAVLWMVANTLGLAYGAAVIIEEEDSGRLTKEDAQFINRHMAVCHSLLEDTLLYVAVGAFALWITLPRVALAGLAVWGHRTTKALAALRRRPDPHA
jgi:hypothetical protein